MKAGPRNIFNYGN